MEGLSILIPTYNDVCVTLVHTLYAQAIASGIPFEILVADDGSTDQQSIRENASITQWEHCSILRREQNAGRAAIRNFLAQQSSFPRLLFVDSDMVVCRADFLTKYLACDAPVIDGGIIVRGGSEDNLRSRYEHAEEDKHSVEQRNLRPYHDFHTANFLIQRDLMLQIPFDERYSHYGYEDVAFGITLKAKGIPISHIDNPLSFEVFETNDAFLLKTEEGLRTLYLFRNELKDYSRLLQFIETKPRPVLALAVFIYNLLGTVIRRQLTSRHPSLLLFKFYKVGYYLHHAKESLSSSANP